MDTLLPGIHAERVPTSRLTVNVLAVAGRDDPAAPAVLFVHGNVSSSLFWQPMMLARRGRARVPGGPTGRARGGAADAGGPAHAVRVRRHPGRGRHPV